MKRVIRINENDIRRVVRMTVNEVLSRLNEDGDEFTIVRVGKGKWNVLKPDGQYLFNKDYDSCSNFKGGFLVRDGKLFNLIDKDGNECYQWTDNMYTFLSFPKRPTPGPVTGNTVRYGKKDKYGNRILQTSRGYIIQKNAGGNIMDYEDIYDNAYVTDDGVIVVSRNGQQGVVGPNGNVQGFSNQITFS